MIRRFFTTTYRPRTKSYSCNHYKQNW